MGVARAERARLAPGGLGLGEELLLQLVGDVGDEQGAAVAAETDAEDRAPVDLLDPERAFVELAVAEPDGNRRLALEVVEGRFDARGEPVGERSELGSGGGAK